MQPLVDLSRTIEMDASGRSVLVLLQQRARARGNRTAHLDAPRAVWDMRTMTRLDARGDARVDRTHG